MTSKFFYVVTEYGCNSTPSHLWTPRSRFFTDYKEAYKYFLGVIPRLFDKENIVDHYINPNFQLEEKELEDALSIKNEKYLIIENVVQKAGYHSGEPNCAKRPCGAVIARIYF